MKEFMQLGAAEVWFVPGSQHLYGPKTLAEVDRDSLTIVSALNTSDEIPVTIVLKPVMTSRDAILRLCLEANASKNCIGVIAWMHTFSPAQMWIAGLEALRKPLLHLHTQFNRDIPWGTIDMNFMNLNQSAHGDREFGFICTKMGIVRKVVVGHWQDKEVQEKIVVWMRAAAALRDAQELIVARIGDNMRDVAVTEGDKVSACEQFGYSVRGYGVGDVVRYIQDVTDEEISRLVADYEELYYLHASLRRNGDRRSSLREAAQIELGLREFLKGGGFGAFTTTFENLHGLKQLPGLAVQRLMADGYGFGAEGDWKTAALVRAMKVMAVGLRGGTSFMEDYTYGLNPSGMEVLGAHMLEICPSIAAAKPSCEIHPLSIGGKADPVRLVFNTPAGPAINASVIDLGSRFRMIANVVDVVPPDELLPKLPVARAVWVPRPNLKVAAETWILAGGAHHTGFSQALTAAYLKDFAKMVGIEFLLIDGDTTVSSFEKDLMLQDVYYSLPRRRN